MAGNQSAEERCRESGVGRTEDSNTCSASVSGEARERAAPNVFERRSWQRGRESLWGGDFQVNVRLKMQSV